MTIDIAHKAVLTLLIERDAGATICPSEVARAIVKAASAYDGADWRGAMPIVHAAIDELVDQKKISLSWQGKPLSTRSGPYRIAISNGRLQDIRT